MKKKLFLALISVALILSCLGGFAGCGGDGSTTPSGDKPSKLNAPVVTLEGNVAKWEANENADKFEISLDGNLSYVENTITSKTLEDGQTLKVRAIGDGQNYSTSDWSNSVTYNGEGNTQNSTNDSTSESTNDSTNESTDESTNDSTNGSTDESTNDSTNGSTDESTNDSTNGSTDESTNDSTNGSTDESTSDSTNGSTSGSTDSSTDGSTDNSTNSSDEKPDNPGTTPDNPGTTPDNPGTTPDNPGENPNDKPGTETEEPEYLGIFASSEKPLQENGLPNALQQAPFLLSNRMYLNRGLSHKDALLEYFANEENRLGEYPEKAEYDIFGKQGETVYIQVWLNNPSQYTILSLKLNGTKYQIGGNLFSFFIEENGQHYNCVYAAVTIPQNTYTEYDYVVSEIEYIANTFINADGTDEFMNENDTISIGLPYSGVDVGSSSLEPSELTTDSYSASVTVTDNGEIVQKSGSWLGFAIFEGSEIKYNCGLIVGLNEIDVTGLAESTEYAAVVYVFGDLHDGQGVGAHIVSMYYFTTKGAVESFDVEAGYYQHWDFPEAGQEADSGLSINVSLSLTSPSATFDRLELYIGDELVYTDEDFNYYTTIEDLLAETTYRVRVYFSDNDYSEHYVEDYVTTGKLEKPEMNMTGKYAFLNSAAFTFDYLENGFSRIAIAKNVRVRIHRTNLEEINMANYILELCDDPSILDKLQAEYDAAIERDDWGTADILYHEKLYFYQRAAELMNYGDYSEYGTDKARWQELFDKWSVTIYLGDEDFFTNNNTAYLIVRDYFTRFESSYEASFGYEILADVNYKDGRGFVEATLSDSSINNFEPVNSEGNLVRFDFNIDGYKVTVNPTSYLNTENGRKIATVTFEVGVYDNNGNLIETVHQSKVIDWTDFDEEAWINAYVCAMKGEAITPSEDKIIEFFGWRAIFEKLLGLDFGQEDDFVGGGDGTTSEDVVVGGDGSVVYPGFGRGEKNIANLDERELLRALMQYEYPDWYEYSFKTSMLESFQYDEYYYDLTSGCDTEDEKLNALIDGALNSTIIRVINDCASGIQHYLTWFGKDTDEIYTGFLYEMERYIEETGKVINVNWEESYRRIMMFEDFDTFYPFGNFETFEVEISPDKYPVGKYRVGVSFRFDSYEENYYEHRYSNVIYITGNLPVPTIEISNDGYVENFKADTIDFWDYHYEVEIKNAQGVVIFSGNRDGLTEGSNRLYQGYTIRARAVMNDGAYSNIYVGDSEWSQWMSFDGIKLEVSDLDYSMYNGGVTWYGYSGYISHFVVIINEGVGRTVSKEGDHFTALKNGDTIKVKAIPTEEGTANGYIESDWVEYTCTDERQTLGTPTNVTIRPDYGDVIWDAVDNAGCYIVEITSKSGEISTVEVSSNVYSSLEIGATYRIRAKTYNEDLKGGDFSEPVTYTVKLRNPELSKVNSTMIIWTSVAYADGYYYKIGENGVVETAKVPRLYLEDIKMSVGESLYVQAYAEGCESSDWVLIYTKEQ